MIQIKTDLPGGKQAQAWVDLDAIVVEVNGQYTIAIRQRCNRETLAAIAALLTEAANGD